ncbi:hypothetical protein [Exiguobacterium acetylicum]|uniref:hypothetical protein n=1 Tax=Exiguobacterium acetylicum TaxID=41170 RepID=UPI001EE1A38D|nr:hypothetical protein [Exiguobacterium acetylicum]UKS57518.1 hypothetical protein K6T22_07875 [Exiguobacterium acetylicum]
MKKTIFSTLTLGVILYAGFLWSNAIADSNVAQEKSKSSITEEQAFNFFTTVLEQQKTDFLNNTPLAHSNLSKLSKGDEAVLIFLSTTEVDKIQLNSFKYKISDVKVYSENQKNYAEAYVSRTFNFGKSGLETGLGDQMVLEIPSHVADQNTPISSSKLTITSNNNPKNVSVDDFLEKYKEEVEKSNKLEAQ